MPELGTHILELECKVLWDELIILPLVKVGNRGIAPAHLQPIITLLSLPDPENSVKMKRKLVISIFIIIGGSLLVWFNLSSLKFYRFISSIKVEDENISDSSPRGSTF